MKFLTLLFNERIPSDGMIFQLFSLPLQGLTGNGKYGKEK
jgi:hypothetical protein